MPAGKLVLAGFSQGSVMAYALGLAAGRPRPGAILAFSGFLPTVEGFELDLETRAGLPVSIAAGSLDPVISVDFARTARDRLTAAGLDVVYREDPVGHTITQAALVQARGVLARDLALGGARLVEPGLAPPDRLRRRRAQVEHLVGDRRQRPADERADVPDPGVRPFALRRARARRRARDSSRRP